MSTAAQLDRVSRKSTIPPLRAGDHLTAEEFERRYSAMPELKKAELLDGVVYMPSPVSIDDHGSPHADFNGFLAYYRAYTPGVQAADNSTLRVRGHRPQPDGLLRVRPEFGGQSSTSEDGYVVGSPELAAEIAASSVSYDLHVKLDIYRRERVLEYVVWRVEDDAIDWFALRGEIFEQFALTAEGWYKSEIFPGLWLDPAAMIRGDMQKVLEVLQQGIAGQEHRDFVADLQARKK